MPWMLPARSDWIIRSENVGSLILLLFEPINTVTSYDTCQVEGRDQPAASLTSKNYSVSTMHPQPPQSSKSISGCVFDAVSTRVRSLANVNGRVSPSTC